MLADSSAAEGPMPYPVPENEAQRNVALRSYGIMDTPPEIAFTEVGELAAQICGCPVSYVAFIEEDRFWMKAKYGLPDDFQGCPREIAFCSVTVCGAELIYSPDLIEDERFRDFHFVVNEPHFRFYCAMPLITPEGYALGTICVMDFQPRELTFEQQETLRRLAHQLVSQLEYRRRLIELDAAHVALEQEKGRADELLSRILPDAIADELKSRGKVEPRFFPSATILFADIKGFTQFTERAEPAALIAMLDRYFAGFDEAVARHGVEKLKTVGDAYIAVAGLPQPDRHHVVNACLAALEMLDVVAKIRSERERLHLPFFEVRIGIHTGPVIAGVLGRRRFTYDVWGDAVNVASLMEANSEPNRINVSGSIFQAAATYFEFAARGAVQAKNKGAVPMYFLERLKQDFARDASGRLANERISSRRESLGLPGAVE
jgi:class 3 adenylate cyclase